jgi:outer membrane protein OmpA-like peptidoglycan-associated protein
MINPKHFKMKTNITLQQTASTMNTFYKMTGRLILTSFTCIFFIQSQAQDKRIVQANASYASGDYYTAAQLYEQFLKPDAKEKPKADFPLNAKRKSEGSGMGKGITKNDIIYKQAESFRLANYFPQAAERYKTVAENDPSKYGSALYWYAVCQRSLGKYDEAEESLNRFLSNVTANDPLKAAAENELQTLKYIKAQLVRPDTVMYTLHKTTLSDGNGKGVFAAVHLSGNQFSITSTETDTAATVGVNPYHSRVFTATLENNEFKVGESVSLPTTDASVNQGAASVSADGNRIYFTQWKFNNGRKESGIYLVTKQGEGWSEPVALTSVNADGHSSKQPYVSTDGKYLFFSSDRPGGAGGFDIWYAPLQADGTTGEAVNTGTIINTEKDEQAPFYHSYSSTLVFSSNGKQGMGGFDLYSAKGWEAEWKSVENMGHPVNSIRDDVYFHTNDKSSVIKNAVFSSDRGSECCLETYTVSKAPKKKIITGLVIDKKDNQPVGNATVLVNAGGKQQKVTTDATGRYTVEVDTDITGNVTVSKHRYSEKQTDITIVNTDESNWSTDKFTNKDIVLDRKIILTPETVVTVYFDFDKHNIKDDAAFRLDSLYDILVKHPGAVVQISGYTDGLGSVEYNKLLSDRRAKACADYLMAKGVDSSRISFESFGECCPLEMEIINGRDNADGRAKNRRGLINISYPPKEEE